jgi:hypothetical protein
MQVATARIDESTQIAVGADLVGIARYRASVRCAFGGQRIRGRQRARTLPPSAPTDMYRSASGTLDARSLNKIEQKPEPGGSVVHPVGESVANRRRNAARDNPARIHLAAVSSGRTPTGFYASSTATVTPRSADAGSGQSGVAAADNGDIECGIAFGVGSEGAGATLRPITGLRFFDRLWPREDCVVID